MAAKSKFGTIQRASRKPAGATPLKPRRAVKRRDIWDEGVREPEEFDFEIDCQRIVQEEADRGRPPYYDEYN